MIPYALTARAQAACDQINHTLGDHLAIAALTPPQRRGRLNAGGHDHATARRYSTLLRLASITESFCADRLLEEVETEVEPARGPAAAAAWADAAVSATVTWKDQQARYKTWLGLGKISWKFVEDLAEARNAIAHGLGTLTRRQLRRRQSIEASLKRIGITLQGDRLIYDDRVLRAIAKSCAEHIERVDEAVSTR